MTMKKYRNNRGFTLGEMLITVAITVILAAVSIINVVPYMWNLRLKDADQAAHEIYLAAQYHLNAAASTGALSTYTRDALGQKDELYQKTYYESADGQDIYDIVVSPDTEKPAILDEILPYGSVDETMRSGGSYIITYDYDSATVLGVFYSYAGRSYGYMFTSDVLIKQKKALQTAMASENGNISSDEAKSVRRHFPDGKAGKTIGFYGGKDSDSAAVKSDALGLNIDNGDTLSALISLNEEQENLLQHDTNSQYYLQLKVYGTTSKKTDVKYLKLSDLTQQGDFSHTYSYILDAYQDKDGKESKRFGNQFEDLYPGEDITVSVSLVKKGNNNTYTSVSKVSNAVKTNSLFASLKNGNAGISSIRHLENLGKYNKNNINVNTASQLTDISFTKYQKNLSALVKASSEAVITYEPVNLSKSLTYDGGYTKDKNKRQHTLSDITTDVKGDGGVFGRLSGSNTDLTVQNLEVMDINARAAGHAGALLGQAEDGASFMAENVLVWDKTADSAVQSTGGNMDAGGLIGHGSGSVTITNSAASIYVQGKNHAGGLAGYAQTLSVKDSYSSGHTYKGRYVNTDSSSDTNGNQRYNIIAENGYAGGLAGYAEKVSDLSYSYTTASIHGSTDTNSAVYVGNHASQNSTYNNNNCYAVTSLNNKMVKEPSDFTGKGVTKTKYVNDQTLLGEATETTYPYTTVSALDSTGLRNAPWFLKTHVGDWSTQEQSKSSVSFNNAEILQLIASVPDVGQDDKVEIQFFYNGKYGLDVSGEAKRKFVFKGNNVTVENQYGKLDGTDWMSDLCKVETTGNITKYTINIDDITYYKHGHHGNFTNVISKGSGKAAGYDVTARVMVNGEPVSDPVYTNSLYGDTTTAETTIINCARHLQNLSGGISDWRANISYINLTSDIFWDTPSNTFFDRVKKLRCDQNDTVDGVYTANNQLIADHKFLSIDGSTWFSQIENRFGFEGNGHTISDISFKEVGDNNSNFNAGLFGYVSNFNISNLTIQNGKIENKDNIKNAGIFVGFLNGGTIKNCYATGEDSVVRIGQYSDKEYGNAGGLIGNLQNAVMKNCGAAVYVQGNNAGGLVGNFNSGSITNSFSGGRTTSGSYLQDAKSKGYFNVEGYQNAGGLVGISGGVISCCYSTSSVYAGSDAGTAASTVSQWGYTKGGGNAGGLIGQTYRTDAMNNCYSTGMVIGPQTTSGALIGNFSNSFFGDTVKNNYYLEGINVDLSTMDELPAVGSGNNTSTTGHMSSVNYYSTDTDPIVKTNSSSVRYFTYSYDADLTGPYPFISWTKQSDDISVHYGGWQVPVNKKEYCRIQLLETDGTKIADTWVHYGSDWTQQFHNYSVKEQSKHPGGNSFIGWIDQNGNAVTQKSFASVITDITVTAKYGTQIAFFYIDPEASEPNSIAALTVNTDGSVNVPVYPSFRSYVFDGWFTKDNKRATVSNGKIRGPLADAYYAHYKKQETYTYTVKFCYENTDGSPGSEVDSLNSQVYERGIDNYESFSQVISLSNLTVPYGKLDKVVAYGADNTIIQPSININSGSFTITGMAQNVTYYVLFSSKQVRYTVQHTFENARNQYSRAYISNRTLNNGENLVYDASNSAVITENKTGSAGSMTAAAIADLGTVADGWELNGSITQKKLGDGETSVIINYRRKIYTVRYYSDGGNYVSPSPVQYGSEVQLPDENTVYKSGYTLTGWTVAYGGVTKDLNPGSLFMMPAADVSVTAKWSVAETADVTVQLWQQKPNNKTGNIEKDYDYVGAYTLKNQPIGQTVSVQESDAKRNVKADFTHFKYCGAITSGNTEINPKTKVEMPVKADGSNTINLYYDRDTINIVFHYLSYYGHDYKQYWYSEINKTTWKGLYGEEFASRKFTWDGNYSWYESAESKEYSVDYPWSQHSVTLYSPGLSRLTFITYFHVEENAKDKNDPNTMNLYGIKQEAGSYYIKHYVQTLKGGIEDYNNGYEQKNSTPTNSRGTFTVSNKYPNGFELYGYRYDWSPQIKKCKEKDTVNIDGNLYVYYKRKDIPITLWNVDVGSKTSGKAYQFSKKYETTYDTIKNYLDQLKFTKPNSIPGEEFAGWYLDSSCEHPFTGSSDEKLTGPLQLFAKWEPAKYQINFYVGDDTDPISNSSVNLQSGDVLYSEGGINLFPYMEVPSGYELKWYYVDQNDNEQPYVMDRQLQKDLIRSAEKKDGSYSIELRARLKPAGDVHLTYQLVDGNGNKVSYNGQSRFTTEQSYRIGTVYHIEPPVIDGYTYVSGADGVASAGTESNPIPIIYRISEGSWYYHVKNYVSYQDIDNSSKKIEVEIPSDSGDIPSQKDELTVSAPLLDGYTFTESALSKDESMDEVRTSSSQVTLNKSDGNSQTVKFWYQPVWDGVLTNTTAEYDGQEHGVTFVPSVMPAIGEHTAVYKYTYTRTLADQKESVVQYVWSDKTGSHTSGQAPVNAGIYTVTVEVLLYDADTVNDPGRGPYLTVYRHVFDGGEELNISPAEVVITSGSQAWTYDGKAHSLNEWSVTVSDVSVKAEESPFTVSFLPTSSLIEPGVIDNTFTYAVKDGYLASNYHVSLVSGKLTVGWQYRVQYVLSLPDCVYEEKSDEEKRKAAEDGTDVKPIQILMYENMATTPAQVLTFNDSSAEAAELDGLKRSDSGVQTIRYTDQNPVVTYVYTLNLDGVQLSTEGDVHIVLDDKEENVQKVLKALKPFLKAAQTDDNTQEAQTADTYDAYQAVKNPDYRLVYRFTYTDSSNNTSVVTYQVDEGGSVSKDTLLSGTVPETAGTYQICGEILLQHRTKTTDEDGNVTETWNDSNILWQSSEAAEYTIGGNSES
jgi:uncharacterized repeat protein (TIGR02543 family)